MTRRRAGRATVLALAALVVVVVGAGNFVLVRVRLVDVDVQTRLSWVIALCVAVGFALGALHARLGRTR